MKKKKKVRIRFTGILIILLLLYLLFYLVNYILDRRITNIYISGNYYLKDYEIISLAGLEDYPSNLKNSSKKISSNLENSIYILDAKVTKKFRKVYIEVKENRPLYYNKNTNKTVLSDKAETDNIYHVPTLLNYIPDTIIDNFIKSMNMLDIDILERISEIEYDPKDGDEYKFLLTMNDGNYVYLTLTGNSFKKLNSYPAMLKKFDGKKGILNLDYGNYLESYK
ncbi:MAG: FtsQ-type POTRA domain-containing protein [Bacillales bacterium]|nr:FtsQ-type POTRA domain-containing protein [Bacillales bacterium]